MKRTALLRDIRRTLEGLLEEISKIDQENINQIPYKGKWTVGQIIEHIIICGNGIPDSKTEDTVRPYDEKVNTIKDLFLNSDLKFETASSLAPKSGPYEIEELIQSIRNMKLYLENVIKTEELLVVCKDLEVPEFGFLTRYEWLRLIQYHTTRHTRQIIHIRKYILPNESPESNNHRNN